MVRFLRIWHGRLAIWISAMLFLTALTGVVYRVGRYYFEMPKSIGSIVLLIHTGNWMGTLGGILYVCLLSAGVYFFIASGWLMAMNHPGISKRNSLRKYHGWAGLFLSIPLLVSVTTGLIFHIGMNCFSLDESTQKFLMMLHEGRWLGVPGKVFYVVAVGLGAIGLALIGLRIRFPKRTSAAEK